MRSCCLLVPLLPACLPTGCLYHYLQFLPCLVPAYPGSTTYHAFPYTLRHCVTLGVFPLPFLFYHLHTICSACYLPAVPFLLPAYHTCLLILSFSVFYKILPPSAVPCLPCYTHACTTFLPGAIHITCLPILPHHCLPACSYHLTWVFHTRLEVQHATYSYYVPTHHLLFFTLG